MGQFALGLRSLLFKAAVFVVMAALLAWALGGTLWPKPEVAYPFLGDEDSVRFRGGNWQWKMSVGGKRSGDIKWELVFKAAHNAEVFGDYSWFDVVGPPIVAEGSLFIGARSSPSDPWRVEQIEIDENFNHRKTAYGMPDRLAALQQLERLKAGLPLQDAETILRQRQLVLEPSENSAD